MTRVLVVEDEQHLAQGLRFNIEAEGYHVETVADGETALAQLMQRRSDYDVVVLDVMLPGIDGFTVASTLRERGHYVPVLMLTARARPEDVLRGFEAGADDYLPKPFELKILLARLRSLVRRHEWLQAAGNRAQASEGATKTVVSANSDQSGIQSPASTDSVLTSFVFDNRIIDFELLELRVGERRVRLTLMEAELLRYLVRHRGRVVSRKAMLEEVWDLHEDTDTRAIDNFIVRLRRYIEDEPSKPKYLLTVRGIGYRFVTEPTLNQP